MSSVSQETLAEAMKDVARIRDGFVPGPRNWPMRQPYRIGSWRHAPVGGSISSAKSAAIPGLQMAGAPLPPFWPLMFVPAGFVPSADITGLA